MIIFCDLVHKGIIGQEAIKLKEVQKTSFAKSNIYGCICFNDKLSRILRSCYDVSEKLEEDEEFILVDFECDLENLESIEDLRFYKLEKICDLNLEHEKITAHEIAATNVEKGKISQEMNAFNDKQKNKQNKDMKVKSKDKNTNISKSSKTEIKKKESKNKKKKGKIDLRTV